jgi:hypothetical protein
MLSISIYKSGGGGDKCECQALPRVLHTQVIKNALANPSLNHFEPFSPVLSVSISIIAIQPLLRQKTRDTLPIHIGNLLALIEWR